MTKSMQFDFSNEEIIVDLFAGGGGASTGIEMALGRSPDIAINHDPEAIALHTANHPDTVHYVNDVFELNPYNISTGRPVGLLWMSPDCKHFSKAKGGKPKSKKIRSLAWIGVKWAKAKRPRVIMLENVEEFKEWGPLDCDGNACSLRKGKTFRAFVIALERLGYKVDWKELRACDYGAPTIRKRLFMVARCDGEDIVFPEPTHADPKSEAVLSGRLLPWVAVSECLDFSLPTPSIFLNKEEAKAAKVRRPLADNTMNRIAKGLEKYVFNNPNPYTITDATVFVSTYYGPKKDGTGVMRGSGMDDPIGTVTAGGGRHALVTAFMAQHNLGNVGRDLKKPVSTLTTSGSQQQLVTSNMMTMRKTTYKTGTDEPLNTITAGGLHHAEVRAFMMKYYGTGEGQRMTDPMHTATTKARFGLVTIKNELYQITDIGMRMLTPRELFRAQGFPDSYKIHIDYNGKPLTKTAQVRMCGNSVSPPMSEALVKANYETRIVREIA